MRYVTSMSRSIFDKYGKEMLEGLVKYWPEGEIFCYSEDRLPDIRGVTYKNIYEVPGAANFIKAVEILPSFRGEINGQHNYKFNINAFSRKVFAHVDAGLGYDGILFWVDADVKTFSHIPEIKLEDWMLGNFMVVMKRTGWHMCTSFIGIDCGHVFAQNFFRHYISVYLTGNVFLLPEWHDAFVFEKVIQNVPGIKDLGKDITGDGPYNVFDEVFKGYATHLKGALKYIARRYEQLIDIVREHKPKRLLEIGTWKGLRAIQFHAVSPETEYVGFDLFESATEETDANEKNVKKHVIEQDVADRLSSAGMKFRLYRGDTKKTLNDYLKDFGEKSADLIYIDGGHSVETIRSDWEHAKKAIKEGGLIIFDDYYTGMSDEEMRKFGAQEVLKDVPHFILPTVDDVLNGGNVQMAVVQC